MELDDPFKIVFSQNMALNEDSPPPIITAERINPVTYKVHVLNASCPYLLVSPLTYDNNWIAEVDSAKLQPIKVNGLFGGWLIDKTGDYIIMVHYITQNYIESAYSVSFAIILVLGLFLILSQCRVKKQQLLRPLFAIRCYSRRKISEK
jgi:hypothetical protein